MSFFFDDASATNGRKKSKEIPINTARLLQCTVCPLKKAGAYNPDMPAWGSPNPLVYFIGEAPGEMEDRENRPFIGPSGEVLAACIPDAFKDKYRLNNTVRSRPPANRTPTALEQACCRASIIKDIKQTQPNIIVALGTTALNWLFEDEKLDRSAEIAKWRGRFFPVNLDGYVCWGYCVYHPSYILRNRRTSKQGVEYKSEHDRLFEADMKRVFDNVSQPKPNYVSPTTYMTGIMYSEGLKSNRELNKVLSWIDKANSLPMTAFDYETNDLRPYKPDSRILTLAIGTDQWCVAFPVAYKNAWTPQQKEILDQAISGYLTNGKPKIAHSTKFELEWSAFFYGQDILKQKDWQDTQGIAYILDERRGTHNLDILIRTYFGFWLKSISNLDRTRMESYPLEKILPYNALDSKWTFALYKVLLQALKQDKKLVKVYNDLLDMMVMLTQIQLRGVVYNDEVTTELLTHHQTKLTEIEELIWSLPEADQYQQAFNAPFNIGSPTATIALYKDVLGREKDLITETGSLSTDEGQLSQLTDPLSISILKWRRHSKVISTYLEPMPKYVMPDGRIHTMYNPYETVTGRLCVAKGTMVEIVRDHSLHPDGIPVENVKAGDYAYTFDNNLNVVLRRVTWSGKTGTKKVMRIHWVGTGNKTKGYIDLTCNHPVRMIDGNYKRADQLDVGDRVLAITKTIANGRAKFWQTGKHDPIANHRFVYQQMIGDIPENWDIHHKDHNSLNDTPQNLVALSNAEHFRLHAKHHWSIPGNVESMVATRQTRIQSGDIYVPSGQNHVAWKEYSKFKLLRLIAKSKGNLTKVTDIDYSTFIRKCNNLNIDYTHCGMRFSKQGVYIGKAKLLNLVKEYGTTTVSRQLKVDYTKLTLLLKIYGYISSKSHGKLPSKYSLLKALSKARGKVGNLKSRGFSDLYKVKKYAQMYNIDLKIVKSRYNKYGVYTASTIPNNHKITKIEWLDDLVDVYDLGVEDTHNFIGNGIALSNSSDSPNLQNFPSKTGKEPRGMIKAPPGHILVCCDYGQIEARLIGVASQDPVFCKALWENYDVHMEWARKIAEAYPKVIHGSQNLDNKKAMKTFRSKVKNLWVFPAFYGASYRSIAAGLKIPESVAQELFEEFWEQFSGVRKWQRWLSDRYNELGYTESLFGRRRHAPLTHNAIINAPIQSSASDICVLSMVKLNQIGLTVVLNVHDEIGFYIPEDQLETQVDQIVREMTRPKLSWLNIPISVEVKIGYDWFNMEESLTVDSTEYYNVPKALFDFRDIYRK